MGFVLLLTSITHFLESNRSQKLHPEIILLCVIAWFWPNYPWSHSNQVNRMNDFVPVSEKKRNLPCGGAAEKGNRKTTVAFSVGTYRPLISLNWSSARSGSPLFRLSKKLQVGTHTIGTEVAALVSLASTQFFQFFCFQFGFISIKIKQ